MKRNANDRSDISLDTKPRSAVLARLAEEVTSRKPYLEAHGYNRTYNRHNR